MASWSRQEGMQQGSVPLHIRARVRHGDLHCEHWIHLCDLRVPGAHCDPSSGVRRRWRDDEGGLSTGLLGCTPGQGAPHYLGCELIGWNVPVRRLDALS